MIYLTFDSNIWIYLLSNASKRTNPLDYLEYWMDEGSVKILLPKIIYEEWAKHKEDQRKLYEEELHNFFSRAKDIFDDAVLRDYNHPEKINEIMDIQFQRIEDIIQKSESIQYSEDLNLKLVNWGVEKKAPMHKQSSVADALIILSLFNYVEKNPDHTYYFVTENKKDFFFEGKIHPHLKPECDRLKITVFKKLDSLVGKLKSQLNVTVNIEAKRKSRFHKEPATVYSSDALKGIEEFGNSYLEDIKDIDIILTKTRPTQNQLLALFGLLENPKLEEYFFRKVTSPNWFSILKNRGYFDPGKNPDPVQVENGYSFPIWQSLLYLESLSLSVNPNSDQNLIEEIVEVIRINLENPKDNYRTWLLFARILKNIPNEFITQEVVDLLPVWFNTAFGTSVQTSNLTEDILPKFVHDASTVEDIEKGRSVLRFLISVNKRELSELELWENEESRYSSKVDIFHFGYSFASDKMELLSNIARYYTDEILLLSESIRKLLSDFPKGVNKIFTKNGESILVKVYIEDRDLIVLSVQNEKIETLQSKVIKYYVDLTTLQIKEKVIAFLSEWGFEYDASEDNEKQFEHLLYFTEADHYYSLHISSVDELDEEKNNSLTDGMLLLLRDLLVAKCRIDPKSGKKILKTLLQDKLFAFPIFTQIVFYVMRTEWMKQKSLFWDLIKNNDGRGYFSDYKFYSDLFKLLELNQKKLTAKEIQLLDSIITDGPSKDKEIEYWQFRWYSALREIDPFKNRYEKLREKFDKSVEDFRDESLVKVTLNSGSVPPLTPEELLAMSNDEILNFIFSFQPDEWRGPSIEGLSDCLKQAVAIEPTKFTEDLNSFVDLLYIYEYKIIHGFIEAWKNNVHFDWEQVLNYCFRCIISSKFISGELSNPKDGWGANPGWVKGAVSELISEGLRKDEHSFNKKYLSIASSIFIKLISEMKTSERADSIDSDYVTFSINTTNGRVLKGFIDYLLWRGRNEYEKEAEVKWNDEDKGLFEKMLTNNILEAYTYVGFQFSQFYFLEPDWLIDKVEKFKLAPKSLWAGFFTGFCYQHPPANEKYYNLFYSHYKRAIENNVYVRSASNHATVRHIAAFHLYGFENLEKESLLIQLIHSADAGMIDELVHYINRQSQFVNDQKRGKKTKTTNRILGLWQYLFDRFKNSEDSKEQQVLGSLTDWIQFMRTLNEAGYNYLITGIKYANRHDISRYLLSNLNRLKTKGTKEMLPKYVGQILFAIDPQHLYHITESEQQKMIDLVTFVFKQNEYDLAVAICNKLAENQIFFLNPVYEKYRKK